MSTSKLEKQQAPFPVRMPAQLMEAVVKAADVNRRSVNGEIVTRLEASFSTRRPRRKGTAS